MEFIAEKAVPIVIFLVAIAAMVFSGRLATYWMRIFGMWKMMRLHGGTVIGEKAEFVLTCESYEIKRDVRENAMQIRFSGSPGNRLSGQDMYCQLSLEVNADSPNAKALDAMVHASSKRCVVEPIQAPAFPHLPTMRRSQAVKRSEADLVRFVANDGYTLESTKGGMAGSFSLRGYLLDYSPRQFEYSRISLRSHADDPNIGTLKELAKAKHFRCTLSPIR